MKHKNNIYSPNLFFRKTLLLMFALTSFAALAQEHQVGPAEFSTSFSVYTVSPESPDATRIAYIRFENPPTEEAQIQPASLWLCSRDDLSDHRKVADFGECTPHNGAGVIWISNQHIALCSESATTKERLAKIYDVDTGKLVFEPVTVSLMGYSMHEGMLPIIIWPERAEESGRPAGVYELDTTTGNVAPLFMMEALKDFGKKVPRHLLGAHSILPPEEWRLFHVKYAPDGKTIAFRFDLAQDGTDGGGKLLAFYHRDTRTFSWFNGLRPNHYFWFDNASIAGHDITRNRLPFRRMRRFDLSGRYLEELGPSGVHVSPSPDKTAFASDTRWRERRGIHYYKRGELMPRFVSDSTQYFHPVARKLRFHENPSFSRDGRRIYYHKAISNRLNGTFYFDLDEGEDNLKPEPIVLELLKREEAMPDDLPSTEKESL